MSENQAETLIDQFGGQSELARLIGKPRSTVHSWTRNGIPARWRSRLQKLARELKIDLSENFSDAHGVADPQSETSRIEHEIYLDGYRDGFIACRDDVIRRFSAPGLASRVMPGIYFANRLHGMEPVCEENTIGTPD